MLQSREIIAAVLIALKTIKCNLGMPSLDWFFCKLYVMIVPCDLHIMISIWIILTAIHGHNLSLRHASMLLRCSATNKQQQRRSAEKERGGGGGGGGGGRMWGG